MRKDKSKLEILQDVRELAEGDSRKKAQANVDNHFFKDNSSRGKKKKVKKIKNSDDLWWD